MTRPLSRRLNGFVQSDIRRMSLECERVGGINLGQGICDLPTEELVSSGAIEAIRSGKATYSRMDGIEPLRKAISAKIAKYNRFEVDPERELVVTAGATGGFACAAMATLNPGDEVILFEPYYGYHLNTLKLLDVTVKTVPLRPGDWSFDVDELRNAFNEKTRAIVVCTPSNPCGKIFSREELMQIGELCREFDAYIFTDEIYEFIVFDGREHLSCASIPELRERTITISGFSKTFSITGWRIGYVTANAEISRAIALVNDLFYICAPTPLQWGVARGLEIADSYYRELSDSYQVKRDILSSALIDSGLTPFVPQGSYYMLADIRPLGAANDRAAADLLLAEAGVASVPGSAFFSEGRGDGMVRFCFAKDFAAIEDACNRIRTLRGAVQTGVENSGHQKLAAHGQGNS